MPEYSSEVYIMMMHLDDRGYAVKNERNAESKEDKFGKHFQKIINGVSALCRRCLKCIRSKKALIP